MNFVVMSSPFHESELMELIDSHQHKPLDFFGQILELQYDQPILDEFFDTPHEKRKMYEKIIDQDDENHIFLNLDGKQEELQDKKILFCEQDQAKHLEKSQSNQTEIKEPVARKQIQNIDCQNNYEKARRTTRCATKLEEAEISLPSETKLVADFTNSSNDINVCHAQLRDKKSEKILRKIGRQIMKQKQFGKSFKISFPKKIVEMFINHYQEYLEEDEQVFKYNEKLKQKLKQNKKNDYTFEKEVSQILGEDRECLEMRKQEIDQISKANRSIFSQIIRDTMKQQVIMRDKIAKNRELYMLQLKVYGLRCRSHRLSKKGTFK